MSGVRIAVLVDALAALLIPPTAGAAITAHPTTKSIPGVQGEITPVKVGCPKGSQFVSGGWKTSDAGGTQGVGIVEAYRVGSRGWRIMIVRYTNSVNAFDVTAIAYCEAGAPQPVTRDKEIVGDMDPYSVAARCPKGSMAQSGGFRQPDYDYFSGGGLVSQHHAQGRRKWRAEVIPGSSGGTLQAEAYCVPSKKRPDPVSEVGDFENDRVIVRTPRCGAAVRAGGYSFSPAVGIPSVYTSRKAGRKWAVKAVDLDFENPQLTAFGYCG